MKLPHSKGLLIRLELQYSHRVVSLFEAIVRQLKQSLVALLVGIVRLNVDYLFFNDDAHATPLLRFSNVLHVFLLDTEAELDCVHRLHVHLCVVIKEAGFFDEDKVATLDKVLLRGLVE